jgi:predicted transcriptional regulator
MEQTTLLAQTAQIVSSQLAHHSTPSDQISALIRDVYTTLTGLGQTDRTSMTVNPAHELQLQTPDRLNPAVDIRQSVRPDYIICLEDGRKMKTLKRHLASAYNLTPDQYRARWGLPPTYPMVAPNYSQTRSALAKHVGLGRRRSEVEDDTPVIAPPAMREAPKAASGTLIRRFEEGASSFKKRGRKQQAA